MKDLIEETYNVTIKVYACIDYVHEIEEKLQLRMPQECAKKAASFYLENLN